MNRRITAALLRFFVRFYTTGSMASIVYKFLS
jgi:hypothetical protein